MAKAVAVATMVIATKDIMIRRVVARAATICVDSMTANTRGRIAHPIDLAKIMTKQKRRRNTRLVTVVKVARQTLSQR